LLITFAAGSTAQTVTVNVNGDTVVEANETFSVNLSSPSRATIGTGSATGTITNDDAMTLAIAATNAIRSEGNSGSTAFTFTITRSGDTSTAATVSYGVSVSGANPANAADFMGGTFPAGTMSFAAGGATNVLTILVNGDTTVEADEGFTVTLSNPSSPA